jgi:hypothetical protein
VRRILLRHRSADGAVCLQILQRKRQRSGVNGSMLLSSESGAARRARRARAATTSSGRRPPASTSTFEISQVEDMVRLTTFYGPDGNALMLAQQLNR